MSLGLSILDRMDLVSVADLSGRIREGDGVSHETLKNVLVWVARYSDLDGRHARPTRPTLVLRTGASLSTVRRALTVLRRRPGLIVPEGRPRKGDPEGVSYTVRFDRIAMLVDDRSLDPIERMSKSAVWFVERATEPRARMALPPRATTRATGGARVASKEVQEVQTVQPLGRKRDSNPWSNQFRADAEPLFTELVERVSEDRDP